MSETEPVYEVWVNREPAIKDGFARFWVEKFWMNSSLKVRGSELNAGYRIFPRGQCVIKFPVENDERSPEDLAQILEQMVNALTEPFKTFVKIEDSQELARGQEHKKEEDF